MCVGVCMYITNKIKSKSDLDSFKQVNKDLS